jgi:hypothetical protein
MSELAPQERPLAEILNPRVTPDMGFQSYEPLAGDKDVRQQQKDAFLAGDIVNPTLDYPRLDIPTLHHGINNLSSILTIADKQSDPDIRAAVWDSAAYRMAEMYWLLGAHEVITSHADVQPNDLDTKVAEVQQLNEQLYGAPETETSNMVLSEIWAQIDAKELSPSGLKLKQELEHGTSVVINDETIAVGGLARVDGHRLPNLPNEAITTLKQKLYADNADTLELIQAYWDEHIAPRPEDERAFTPQDMFTVFKAVHTMRDPENTSGVAVVMHPSATALSWETPLMAVIVGGKRAPIKNVTTMFSKVVHEYEKHGASAVSGVSSELPVLGTGLYTDSEPGEQPDYLTFEEGWASTCEEIVAGKVGLWTTATLERYTAVLLAYEGRDIRQNYETLWRMRALLNLKSNEDVTDAMITKAQSAAYASEVRIYRGTPTEMSRRSADNQPRVLTYNKDLAYLKGKLLTVKFWEKYGHDPDMVDLVFKGKFDPMNARQLALAQKTFQND